MFGPRLVALAIPMAFTAGCKFPYPESIDIDAATAVDATVDASIACVPDSIVCDDALGVYTDCSTDGIVELQLQCPLGCATDMEKCVDIDPSNGLAIYLDMALDPPDLLLEGTSVIDTEMGTIFVNGESVSPPRFLSGGIRVFVVRSMSITGNVTVVHDYASPALAFVSLGDVSITGTLDVSADLSSGGPSASWGGDQSGLAKCNAGWAMVAPGGGGAGGAGGVDRGGDGGEGTESAGLDGGDALTPFVPFWGGCEGGTSFVGTGGGAGGGGGGALQIASRSRIELQGAGTIDASGGGGQLTTGTRRPGSGGGAGGNILLEAPQIVLNGRSVVISTKGGAGSGAGTGPESNGADGGIDAAPAAGGNSTFQSHGGAGGTATAAPTEGFYAMGGTYEGGGGGGSAGMTGFATTAGTIVPVNGAAIRSKSTMTTLGTRYVP